MCLDIHIHAKNNISRKAKTSYNLGWREYITRYIITVEIIQNLYLIINCENFCTLFSFHHRFLSARWFGFSSSPI
jgi:hypothetical protein